MFDLEKLLKIGIAALALVALTLAVLLYVKSGYHLPSFGNVLNNVKTSTETSPVSQQSNENISKKSTDVDLKTPGANATAEEQQKFFDHTVSVAETSTSVHLSLACATTPKVVKIFVKDGGLTFINDDTSPHTVVFDAKNAVTIEPKAQAKVSDVFKRGGGIYGYGCDSSSSAVGIVYMVE